MSSRWPIALAPILAIALALASGSAAALGLGQIQVKSKPGQPLLAEIPILSTDPSELQGLQVQLASPDTFRRVGLEPPQGAAATLRFEPALDADGRPVVRVTSVAPISEPALTFLLEVDWSQGRLVREYSALIDAPRTVAAMPQPIQAPVVAPSNTIVRPPEPAPAPVAAAPTQPSPTPAAAPASTPVASTPPPPAEASPPPAVAPPTPPVVASTQSDVYGPVRPGQTLGKIAAGLDAGQGHTLAQTMLALLRSNPDAFIGGNINQLKAGAVLRLPASDEFSRVDQRQAAALVHQQIAQWRQAQQATPEGAQPEAPPARVAAANGSRAAPSARPVRSSDARLEIVPPSSSRGQAAGTNKASGIQAGGEGDMLQQQLQETRETLAARDAEVGELKTRVAELEKLQAQQQQLLTLKDTALAQAQQRLATVNQAPAIPATAATTQAPATPTPTASNASVWLWGGLVLVVAALLGWLLARRRPTAVAAPRRPFDTEMLAAGMVAAKPASGATAVPSQGKVSVGNPVTATKPATPPAVPAVARAAPIPAPADAVVPPWHGGAATDASATTVAPASTGIAAELADPAQKLEQAQAFIAMGDDDTARELLRDVLDGRDPAARDRAARLLRDL